MKKVFTLFLLAGLVFNYTPAMCGEPDKSTSIDKLYWDAVKMYKEENYCKAVLYFTHLAEQTPENQEYNYYAGMCYFHLNKPRVAKYYFNQVAEDNVYVLKIKVLSRIEDDMGFELPEGL